MKFSKLVLVALVSSVFFVSCTDDDNNVDVALGSYDNGVLILNEGGFGKGNASVSYLSDDFASLQNSVFSIVNPAITLGDTAQDIGFYQELAFIVLNGSNKIEVVNRYTMAHVATIDSGLDSPRYIVFANGKGFVSNWAKGSSTTDDFVAVINLSTYTVTSTISVAEGPNTIVVNNNNLYVAHSGGWGYGKTVSVINSSDNSVSTTITVGDVPNSLEISNGVLYVLCGGKSKYSGAESAGSLHKINLSDNTVSSTLDFAAATHPSNLDIEGEAVFYTVGSSIYKSTVTATTLPTSSLFSTTAQDVYGVYSFAVNDAKIYVGDAGDYNSNGKVYIYSNAGVLEHEYTVGIIPAGFYFN